MVAADLSHGMIDLVRKRQGEDPSWAKIEPTLCNAMVLSAFAESSLSHVFSGFTIFFDFRSLQAISFFCLRPSFLISRKERFFSPNLILSRSEDWNFHTKNAA